MGYQYMGLKKVFWAIVISLVLLPVTAVMADSATVSNISKQLICQCGCNMVLSNCSHAECASRETMTALIEQKLTQGQSEEQVIQFFVTQYGEQVLASPPKKGFNLTAWIAPFAVILIGGGIIYVAIRRWVSRSKLSQPYTVVEEDDEKYRRQLEEELKEFTERSFR